MSQQRRGLLFNGTPKSAAVRTGGAFDLQESPIIVASSGLTGPVGIQYLLNELDEWVDVMVNDEPLQLSPSNTFLPLTVQGAYRIKPGAATGAAVIWFTEVTSVPEWGWGGSGSGSGSGAGAPQSLAMTPDGVISLSGGGGSVDVKAILLPVEMTNLDGSVSVFVG